MTHWASIIFAPLVLLANLSIAYALVPLACQMQRSTPLHLSNGIALALTLAAWLFAWRSLRSSRMSTAIGKDDLGRTHFLSEVGVWVSAISALAIALQWSTQAVLSPCFS